LSRQSQRQIQAQPQPQEPGKCKEDEGMRIEIAFRIDDVAITIDRKSPAGLAVGPKVAAYHRSACAQGEIAPRWIVSRDCCPALDDNLPRFHHDAKRCRADRSQIKRQLFFERSGVSVETA